MGWSRGPSLFTSQALREHMCKRVVHTEARLRDPTINNHQLDLANRLAANSLKLPFLAPTKCINFL